MLLVKFWAYVPSARCFSMLTLGSYDVPTLFDVALEIGLTLVNTIGYVFENSFCVEASELRLNTDDFGTS